jgi:exodeoxyribonuclease VII small subunit
LRRNQCRATQADAIDRQGRALQACGRSRSGVRKKYFHIVATQKLRSPDSIVDSAADPASTPDFERSLAELEAIVDKLEAGDLSLDDSLKQFERGVHLTRVCQTALKQAEQKVEILLRKSGANDLEPTPFEPDDQDI